MQKYLNMFIKKVIDDYPEVGTLLENYEIGCVPCNVGTCLLKDIVSIHNLPKKDENQLMFDIENVIYPDRDVKLKEVTKEEANVTKVKVIKHSPPMKILVDEHKQIMQVVNHIPNIISYINSSDEIDKELVLNTVRFIREYADKFHHAKEELILFDYADRSLEIINVILEDHKTSREYMKLTLEGVEKGDKSIIAENLSSYKILLTEHIKKEDEVLYPWIDRGITTSQVGEMYQKFLAANVELGSDLPERNLSFLESLNKKFAK